MRGEGGANVLDGSITGICSGTELGGGVILTMTLVFTETTLWAEVGVGGGG